MKKILYLAVGVIALNVISSFGQSGSALPVGAITVSGYSSANSKSELTKFNLDFPGGTAAELVKAIEKAMGKPLNVIIASDEKSAKAKMPPIKVTDMDVARLFESLRKEKLERGEVVYGERFFTRDEPPKDNSLWKFGVYEKQPALTQFNLDFPGGTPAQLVKAIEKAIGKPLNVVVADEDAATKIPALKMNDVNVASLFTAVAKASQKQVSVITSSYYSGASAKPSNSYSTYSVGYMFETEGQATDNSVWYFRVTKPALPPVVALEKTCQYFSLAEYLNRGFTVEDITTAIQTGWKLSGETAPPELNYHKETKLLMAYGEPTKLETISRVLNTLPMEKAIRTQEQYEFQQNRINQLFKEIANLKSLTEKMQKQLIPAPPSGASNPPAEKSGK